MVDTSKVLSLPEGMILRRAIKERGTRQTELAEKIGMKQSSLSSNINRRKMGLGVFRNILDAMEYDVVIVDRKTGEPKWVLDSMDDDI